MFHSAYEFHTAFCRQSDGNRINPNSLQDTNSEQGIRQFPKNFSRRAILIRQTCSLLRGFICEFLPIKTELPCG
jgi:hypothetical protein